MYSGGDSSGDGVNSRNQFNWQMTSQTSCNINSGGAIDWASLAQQWIQMKDSGAGLPDTPPPPAIIANSKAQKTTKFDEQGEADMEVEKDDEQQVVGFGHGTPPPPVNNLNPGRWFPPQQDPISYCAPQQPTQWTPWPARVALPPPTLHVPITTGSLTPPMPKEVVSTTPPLQTLPKLATESSSLLPHKDSLEPPPMDAAKRKILPAWIREGLEKMEREKLKQLEREQKDKEPVTAGTAADDSDINNKFKSMVKSSIMEMEGESSGNEATIDVVPSVTVASAGESPAADADTDVDVPTKITNNTTSNNKTNSHHEQQPQKQHNNSNSGKTYEERLSDMMIAVRKTLTELLLEVTNEEISSIAHEAIRKRRAKASSAQVFRKSAIPSITGKLGLEAYADSDSENSASDDDGSDDSNKRSDEENDSEEELKANIRICKRAFAKTVEEIEERIQASAMREEMLLREHQRQDIRDHKSTDYSRSPLHKTTKGFDTEIGEPQPDKKSNSNGKRRKERTSRFSDNKDSRHRVASSYFPPPSMGSGSLPSPVLPGSSASVPPTSKYKTSNSSSTSSSVTVRPAHEKQPSNSSSYVSKSSKQSSASTSSSSKHRHRSDSPSYSSDSTSSGTPSSHSHRSKYSASRNKRTSTERSKRSHRSSSYRSQRRRDSSAESVDEDHYKKRSSSSRRKHKKGSSSSTYSSRRRDRHRSDSRSSRSRTRSRSRSRSTTYSSSRRGTDRY